MLIPEIFIPLRNQKYKYMNNLLIHHEEKDFIESLKQIVHSARKMAYASVNYAQVASNWLIGRRIVEQMQGGKEKAEYGTYIIKIASEALTKEFGQGYSVSTLKFYRQFYLTFPDLPISSTVWNQSVHEIGSTVYSRLTWSHYKRLMRVENLQARQWYEQEAKEQMWSYRTLDRNISTLYYERMLMSQVKESVVQEMQEKTKEFQQDKLEFIKNPAVLEFLGLPSNKGYKEQELEQAILDNLQGFLLEMGKGFAFVARQELVRTDTEDYYIDLVFFNYLLNCFVLVDLKVGKITHQDVGQMDMYVRMFDELKRGEGHNPTIGIVLCSETSKDMARYSILKGNEQLFATKYKLLLPTPEELQAEIENQKQIYLMQMAK